MTAIACKLPYDERSISILGRTFNAQAMKKVKADR
jgi:hypothetical protein